MRRWGILSDCFSLAKHIAVIALLWLPVMSRAQETPAPSPTPNPLDAVAAIVQETTGKPVRRYSMVDFGREQVEGNISVIVREAESENMLASVRPKLPRGFVAFIGTTQWLGTDSPAGIELVVAPGRDQFDIVRAARTDAVNYDMGTEDIVRHLKALSRYASIDILKAETDSVEFAITKMPKYLPAFSRELYEFCPDIVEQGVGTVEALQAEIEKTKRVRLWWD
jgi:hypothetical protein